MFIIVPVNRPCRSGTVRIIYKCIYYIHLYALHYTAATFIIVHLTDPAEVEPFVYRLMYRHQQTTAAVFMVLIDSGQTQSQPYSSARTTSFSFLSRCCCFSISRSFCTTNREDLSARSRYGRGIFNARNGFSARSADKGGTRLWRLDLHRLTRKEVPEKCLWPCLDRARDRIHASRFPLIIAQHA